MFQKPTRLPSIINSPPQKKRYLTPVNLSERAIPASRSLFMDIRSLSLSLFLSHKHAHTHTHARTPVNISPQVDRLLLASMHTHCSRPGRVTDTTGRKRQLSGTSERYLTCGDDDSALVRGHVWGWHVLLLHVAVVHPDCVRAAHHLPAFRHAAFLGGVPGGEKRHSCITVATESHTSLGDIKTEARNARWRG